MMHQLAGFKQGKYLNVGVVLTNVLDKIRLHVLLSYNDRAISYRVEGFMNIAEVGVLVPAAQNKKVLTKECEIRCSSAGSLTVFTTGIQKLVSPGVLYFNLALISYLS